MFTYLIHSHGSVQLLNTTHRPALQPMLGCHALCSPRPGLPQGGRNKHTVVPVRNLPLEEVSVPVTDSEAASFLQRPIVLITIRQVTRPPSKMETPKGTTLDSSWPTVSCTPSPGACRQKDKGVSYSKIPHHHPHKNGSICTPPDTTSVKLL